MGSLNEVGMAKMVQDQPHDEEIAFDDEPQGMADTFLSESWDDPAVSSNPSILAVHRIPEATSPDMRQATQQSTPRVDPMDMAVDDEHLDEADASLSQSLRNAGPAVPSTPPLFTNSHGQEEQPYTRRSTHQSSQTETDSMDTEPWDQSQVHAEVLELPLDPTYEVTQEEVEEYAVWLGMDLQQEKELLWIAREGLNAPCPPNWKPCKTLKGDVYYFNFSTGDSIWDHPLDERYRKLLQEEREKLHCTRKRRREEEEEAGQQSKKVEVASGPQDGAYCSLQAGAVSQNA